MSALKLALLSEADRLQDLRGRLPECPVDTVEVSDALFRSLWLIRTLAHIAGGTDVLRAFGAPGDWGYGTPIGDALRKELEQRTAASAPSISPGRNQE